jgi:hypothetical protein
MVFIAGNNSVQKLQLVIFCFLEGPPPAPASASIAVPDTPPNEMVTMGVGTLMGFLLTKFSRCVLQSGQERHWTTCIDAGEFGIGRLGLRKMQFHVG